MLQVVTLYNVLHSSQLAQPYYSFAAIFYLIIGSLFFSQAEPALGFLFIALFTAVASVCSFIETLFLGMTVSVD